jgi:hypothetical protein
MKLIKKYWEFITLIVMCNVIALFATLDWWVGLYVIACILAVVGISCIVVIMQANKRIAERERRVAK